MRVFLPSTLPALTRALQAGHVEPGPGFAVTPALREAYASGDTEELEYAALTEAARDRQALERLKAHRLADHEREAARLLDAQLDEIATNGFFRKAAA